jgi:hypothetical protein
VRTVPDPSRAYFDGGAATTLTLVAGTKVSLATATVDQLNELRKRPRKQAVSGAHKVRAAHVCPLSGVT